MSRSLIFARSAGAVARDSLRLRLRTACEEISTPGVSTPYVVGRRGAGEVVSWWHVLVHVCKA